MAMYNLNVNGTAYQANVSDAATPLLWVLRDILGLTGTKYGCGIEVCGACTVLMDGQPAHACVIDISSAAGRKSASEISPTSMPAARCTCLACRP